MINRVIAAIFPIMISQSPCSASFLSELNTDINAVPKSIEEVRRPKKSIRAHAYSVEFTDPPCLSPRTLIGERGVLERLISSDSVIIGKHRGDSKDTELEINLLSRAIEDARSKKRTVAIGLTDIPNLESCQTAIDTYVSNKQVIMMSSFYFMHCLSNPFPWSYICRETSRLQMSCFDEICKI